MGCCGDKTTKRIRQIATGYTNLFCGKKYEFTDDRVRTCQMCESNYWIGGKLFCSLCKCFIPAKARAVENTCPLGKWEK